MSASISEAKRYVKRIILTNIYSGKDGLSITPLISGRHGIGKSQMMKQIAYELGGSCEVIEGGTLKEGEITGLPYQYKDESGEINFSFLPYYVIKKIQNIEKLNSSLNALKGHDRLQALKNGDAKILILFFDEINRTESAVYRELMNILLTRSVNGYNFPWWVQIVGAMNPGSQNSEYAVNEMDPAQLDRFLKIKVDVSTSEWLSYAEKADISPNIRKFIKNNPKSLSYNDEGLEDCDEAVPSPRGWEMVSLLLTCEPELRDFFNSDENSSKRIRKDMYELMAAKLGYKTTCEYFKACDETEMLIIPEEVFKDDEMLTLTRDKFDDMTRTSICQSCNEMLEYLKNNSEKLILDSNKAKLNKFIKLLDDVNLVIFCKKLQENISNKSLITGVIDDYIFDKMDLDSNVENTINSVTI